jgi:hypothetical protein
MQTKYIVYEIRQTEDYDSVEEAVRGFDDEPSADAFAAARNAEAQTEARRCLEAEVGRADAGLVAMEAKRGNMHPATFADRMRDMQRRRDELAALRDSEGPLEDPWRFGQPEFSVEPLPFGDE